MKILFLTLFFFSSLAYSYECKFDVFNESGTKINSVAFDFDVQSHESENIRKYLILNDFDFDSARGILKKSGINMDFEFLPYSIDFKSMLKVQLFKVSEEIENVKRRDYLELSRSTKMHADDWSSRVPHFNIEMIGRTSAHFLFSNPERKLTISCK